MTFPAIFRTTCLNKAATLSRPFLAALVVALSGSTPEAIAEMPDTVADGAELVEVYSDPRFFEGPTWDPRSDKLYFTAFGENNHAQILRLDGPGKVSVFKDNSQGTNGTYLARDGRMLGAQAFGHCVMRYDLSGGGEEVLLHDDAWFGPNDICQSPRGDVYFTDPDFEKSEASAVYRLADGRATKIATDLAQPNGCLTSNDGTTLYVSDSGRKHWKAYPISPGGEVGAGRVFFDPDTDNRDSPDGMTIDEHGNLYFTGRGGVWVVTPEGQSKGLIRVLEFCSNATFGGADGKTLYLTCSKKVYALAMRVCGGQFAAQRQ